MGRSNRMRFRPFLAVGSLKELLGAVGMKEVSVIFLEGLRGVGVDILLRLRGAKPMQRGSSVLPGVCGIPGILKEEGSAR